ncbi:MAG: DsbE family thiol:disulfide interchange protein [Pseudomonas sp.]
MRRPWMLIPLVLFVLLLALFLVTLKDKKTQQDLAIDPSTLPSALIDKPFPEFNLSAVEEGAPALTRADMLGRPALVNVWATWCVACRVEHPVLNALAEQGVIIHGVNYKDNTVDARQWLKEFHDPYQLNISDVEGRLGLDLGVYGAPETFLIDAKGVIRYKFIGVVDERVWETQLGPRYQALVDEGAQP